MERNIQVAEILTAICIGLGLRAIVSLHPYSGMGKPPLYGDYEAQRHWQEVTVNLELRNWYKNSSDNDLQYWGLDYPPLTAYHSYLLGLSAKSLDKRFVELNKSRGIESDEHKSFMRATVLLADIFVYAPACVILVFAVQKVFRKNVILPCIFLFMLYPGQILIDNGHFQYNNISLALAAFAIAAVLYDRYYLSALLYSLSLNYKQMELYHALPFFAHLLRVCYLEKRFTSKIRRLADFACIVLFTFIILWSPWLRSLDDATSIMRRLFPIKRGIFEDKVANLWCAVNVLYKLKLKLSYQQSALLCLFTTIVATIPLNILQFKRANKLTFIYTLFTTSMAFFLFSFQVHEKSILLVALPACTCFTLKPFEILWFLEISVFSMLPLIMKDGLTAAYFALMCIFHVTITALLRSCNLKSHGKFQYKMIRLGSMTLIIIVTIAACIAQSPVRYPDIWPLLISLLSCGHFVIFYVLSHFYQLYDQGDKRAEFVCSH